MAEKSKQVKTYRVLHDGMKVGDSVRNFGDLMPEASTFSNLRSYLNSDYLEEIWVDQSVIDDFYKEQKKSSKVKPVEDNDSDDPDTDSGDPGSTATKARKRVATKKKVAKKAAKKTVKGKKNNGLEERSV